MLGWPPAAVVLCPQAAQFLVLDSKAVLNLGDIRHDICPALSTQQLYRLATTFYDDVAQVRFGLGCCLPPKP